MRTGKRSTPAAEMQTQDPELDRCFRGHRGAITSAAFCGPSLKQAVSGSLDACVYVYNFAPNMRAFRYLGHAGAVYCVAYNAHNNLIASASKDCTVRLWKPTAEGRSTVLKAHTAAVRCCAFSQNGQMLATCSDDRSIKVWSVAQQKFLFSLSGHTNWVRTCQLSPDARLAVSGGDDHTVRVWDTETRAQLHAFNEMEGTVNVARFHPDGNCVATGGTDGCIKLWDLRSPRIIQYYEAHDGAVTDCAFHPSGNFLLSSSAESALKVWDLQEGLLFYTLQGHEGPALGVNFSPAGDYFISGGADEQVLVWRTNFDACLEQAALSRRNNSSHGLASQQPCAMHVGAADPRATVGPAARQLCSVQHKVEAGRVTANRKAIGQGGNFRAMQLGAATNREQVQKQTSAAAGQLSATADASTSWSGELPEGLATVLQHVVQQLETLTQTVSAIEERLSISEDSSRRMEAAVAHLAAKHKQQVLGGERQAEQPQQLPVGQAEDKQLLEHAGAADVASHQCA